MTTKNVKKKTWYKPVLLFFGNAKQLERRLHTLRKKIIQASNNYRNNPTRENYAVLEAYAKEKLRVEKKYNVNKAIYEN